MEYALSVLARERERLRHQLVYNSDPGYTQDANKQVLEHVQVRIMNDIVSIDSAMIKLLEPAPDLYHRN